MDVRHWLEADHFAALCVYPLLGQLSDSRTCAHSHTCWPKVESILFLRVLRTHANLTPVQLSLGTATELVHYGGSPRVQVSFGHIACLTCCLLSFPSDSFLSKAVKISRRASPTAP